MQHSSYIELNKSALQHNINFLKQELGSQVKLSSVVKGNAYGHGIEQFGPMAQECGVEHFSVFSVDEAFRLHQVLQSPATIMIMGFIEHEEMEWAINNAIEFYVFDLERLHESIEISKKLNKNAIVHLEVETGMNRTGFNENDLQNAIELIHQNRAHLTLRGICTHYAGAESLKNHERVLAQQNRFNQQVKSIQNNKITPQLRHTACSAAMITYPESRMDMVRVGIMQYGFWSSPETYSQYVGQHNSKKDPLRRLITWKTHIMSLKSVAEGDFIGYGTSYQAPRDMVLAIVPVGYAWGYSRALSNQGQVLIQGQRAKVVGMVNMNVMMVDVTHIDQVKRKDEVVLLGHQKGQNITVDSFGELSTQLNYELLTRLPMNIPRIVVD